MRLNVTKQNTIEVENSRKEDVYFVIVDNVFFERQGDVFNSITNNNLNNYDVKILPTDNVFLELKITSTKDLEPVFIVIEDRQYNHGSIMFKPVLV
ncbi:hypothetical protein QPD70_18100 [Clostridioides difficile]|nr:hypothetical protein [Clostridioides difficile]MDK3395801.1 hypothetical protein [Clostridioides difficile]